MSSGLENININVYYFYEITVPTLDFVVKKRKNEKDVIYSTEIIERSSKEDYEESLKKC